MKAHIKELVGGFLNVRHVGSGSKVPDTVPDFQGFGTQNDSSRHRVPILRPRSVRGTGNGV